jgi:hypothetical protein
MNILMLGGYLYAVAASCAAIVLYGSVCMAGLVDGEYQST